MSEEPVTISLSSDEDEDGSFFRKTTKKPRLSSIKGINGPSSSTSKKQPKKVKDKIDVVIVSESQRNIEDFVEFKKRFAPEKKLKNELPNPKSHKFFKRNQNHSIRKTAKPPDSPDCVVLDPDADNLKSDNLTDIICNITNISPNKSGALEQKSKILEEEFSTENKNDKMPKPSREAKVLKPKSEGSLKHNSFDTNKNKFWKGQVTKDSIRKSFVNGCKKVGNSSKHIKVHEKKPIEVVNLDDMNDVPDKEKVNEAVQEEKGAMDCMDNETTNSEKIKKDQKEVGSKCEKAEIKENEKEENMENDKVNCEESKENESKRKRKNENENNNNTKDISEAKRVKIEETCATNVPEIYNEFLALLESLEENKEDVEKALKKLSKYHSLADPTYTSSSEFKQFLKEVCNIVKNNSMELYPTLHTIFARLKKRRQKTEKKVLLTPAPEVEPSATDKAEILKEMINPEEVVQTSAIELKNRRAVRRLSKTLQKLEKKIKQIEQIDVDLEDENDSSYLRMQTYRQRFCQVYKKLCEYTGDSPEAGRVCKSKIPFNGTKNPAVNKCIERWLNRKKVFPDFTDILKLIEEQNKVDKLNLTPEGIRTLATDAFTKVGEMLQRIRIHDFWNTYSEYLDVGEDPADKDPQLQESLRRNKEASSKKIAEILDHYCERQVKEHYVAEEVPDEEADRSPAESGDEDEKEIEEVENSLIEDYNALSEDEAKPDEEQNSNGKSKKHPSAGENSTEPDAAQPPTGETEEKPEEATATKESKNNYKHCKSLKWRRENNLNVSSDLSSEDNKKPGSDEKTGSDSNSEKNEIFLNKEPVEPDKSAEDDKPVAESKTDSIEEEVTVRKEEEEEDSRSKDFECEVIEVDPPVIKSSDKIYEQLKNNFNAQPFFVNYVRVEYFSKELQRESFKNPFDRSSGYALRDSTNLDEIIHLKDEGFRDNFKNSKKNKENRSFNYLKSKKSKTFNVPFKKRARKNIFITKCVSENKENNGTSNGEERGKEKEQSREGEEKNEEAEEGENSAGNNGSGNGRDDDEGGEDKDSKGNDEEEEKEEEEEESEKHEEEEVNEKCEEEEANEKCEEEVNEKHEEEEEVNERREEEEVNDKHEEEVNDKHEEEEEIERPEEEDGNFEQENGCGHEEDRMNGNYDAETDEDSVDLNGKAEKVKGTDKDYDNDFDKKLKAFEDALEFDEEEEPHGNIEEKEPEEKRKTDDNGEEVDEKMEEDPVDTNEDEASERMEEDKDRENGEDQVYENGDEEQPNTNSEIDPGEKMEDHSNDSVEKNKNENEEDVTKEDKTDEPMEQEEKKSPGENGDDASEKSEEAAPESKENEEETINDCKQDDSVDKIETKTESEDTNETESKTDEDDGESSGKKPDGEEEMNEDVDSKPETPPEFGEATEEQTKEDSTSLEPSEDLGDEEPGPSSKRKANETTDVEVLSVKKPKTSAAKTDPLDEEIVQNFLRHSPSSISITPPKKFSKPPSQEALNALATLRQMKSISTTRVSRRGNEDDVQVIGESSIRRISNNGPVSITRVKRNQAPQPNNRSRGVPVISNVQSINRNNSLTPKIVTVQGNVSSFHNNRNFNFGMPNRMINNMNQMNMNVSRMNIPGFNHFPGFNSSRFNNFSMFNNRQQPPLKISNVRGNITQTFRPQLHQQQRQQQQPQPRRFVNPSATNVRPAAPAPSSTVTKDKSKKPVEYVVLE